MVKIYRTPQSKILATPMTTHLSSTHSQIFCTLLHYSHISANCAYRIFFRINWHFQRQLEYSLYFYCPLLLGYIALTIWLLTEWHHPCIQIPVERDGVVGFKQFCTIFPYFRRKFDVYAVRIFFKCRMKLTCLTDTHRHIDLCCHHGFHFCSRY